MKKSLFAILAFVASMGVTTGCERCNKGLEPVVCDTNVKTRTITQPAARQITKYESKCH